MDPEDRAILTAHMSAADDACPGCGRPKSVHLDLPRASDYGAAYLYCPAADAVDKAQARKAKEDTAEQDKGRSPERARFWFSETPSERAAREWLAAHPD